MPLTAKAPQTKRGDARRAHPKREEEGARLNVMEHTRTDQREVLAPLRLNYGLEHTSVREKTKMVITDHAIGATPTTLDQMKIQRLKQKEDIKKRAVNTKLKG